MQNLRLFCDVAALRNLSRAAEVHSITQSAASQRIRQLESKFGVQLLDRSVRPVGLTAAGEVLAREAADVVSRYDNLVRKVARAGSPEAMELRGAVRLDAIYSAGIGLLERLRDLFQEQHPGLEVVLEYRRPEKVAAAVSDGRCELGIVSYPRTWKGLAVRALRDERMCVVCSAGHAMAARRSLHASALGGLEMVGFEPDLPVARSVRRYLKSQKVSPGLVQAVDNIDTMKNVVAATGKVAILPQRTVLREVEAGTLAALALEPELLRPLGIVWARGRSLSPGAQALLDFLAQHAGPLPDDATAAAAETPLAATSSVPPNV